MTDPKPRAPRVDDNMVPIGPVDMLEDGRGRPLDALGLPIALFRHRGHYVALEGRCPHAGGVMGRGWIEGDEVVCPLHYWRFRLADGACTNVPQSPGLTVHRCEVRDGQVWVERIRIEDDRIE